MAAAEEQAGSNPAAAAAALRGVVTGPAPNDAECLKVKEAALGKLTELLVKQRDAAALRALLTELRPLFAAIPKAKTAKIVRTVVDSIARVPDSSQLLVRRRGGRGEAEGRRGRRGPGCASSGGWHRLRRMCPLCLHCAVLSWALSVARAAAAVLPCARCPLHNC